MNQTRFTTETQRHREQQSLIRNGVLALAHHPNTIDCILRGVGFPLCLCASDETTSHSTKAGKSASQVAGYVVKVF